MLNYIVLGVLVSLVFILLAWMEYSMNIDYGWVCPKCSLLNYGYPRTCKNCGHKK